MTLATINAIWIGRKLGRVHAACLRSFLQHGHRVFLHVYERPVDVPDGVELADAGKLLPQSRMVRHSQTGSPAVFADFLRYELLRQGLGLYVDCDCYCLKPIEDGAHIFGFESGKVINNAVLKLPPDSPALTDLCKLKDVRSFVPEWATGRRKFYYRVRAMSGFPVRLQNMPWGFTGPHALTWYLKKHGLDRHASPIDDFYPLHFSQTPLLFDPDLNIEHVTTPRTRIVHLAAQNLKKRYLRSTPPTSPLGVMLANA